MMLGIKEMSRYLVGSHNLFTILLPTFALPLLRLLKSPNIEQLTLPFVSHFRVPEMDMA